MTFDCNPEKYNCNNSCCKEEPYISFKDIFIISKYFNINTVDTWGNFGNILFSKRNNETILYPSLRKNIEYCVFLDNSKCNIHSVKPEQCEIFPCKTDFENYNFKCFINENYLNLNQIKETENKINSFSKRANTFYSFLFQDIDRNIKIPNTIELEIMSSKLYEKYPKREEYKDYLFFNHNLLKEKIIQEYLFIKNFDVISEKLEEIQNNKYLEKIFLN